MLQEYDAKNKRAYKAAVLPADFSEWLYIK